MEINSNSRHNALNNTEIINTDIIRSYQDLQDKLKDNLTDSFMSVFIQMFNKLSNEERKYFNEDADKNLNVNWVININTVANNRGDLSTSSMQKVFHSLFIKEKEPDSEFDTNFCKFKKDFIDLLYCKFTVVLNSQTDQISNEYVERYEIKNGFLNIYLKGKGLQLLQEEKDYKKPSKQLENNFCVCLP